MEKAERAMSMVVVDIQKCSEGKMMRVEMNAVPRRDISSRWQSHAGVNYTKMQGKVGRVPDSETSQKGGVFIPLAARYF